MRHAVITTPHEFCENHAAVLDHACDTVSEYTGRALADLLVDRFRVTTIRGTTNRRRLDLNRRDAHDSPFQQEIDMALRPGDILLDVHSYPGGHPDPVMQDWGRFDLVFPAYAGVNDHASEQLAAELRRSGVRAKTVSPEKVPDLDLYYVIQRFGPRARPGIMLEFNEDIGLTRLNTVLDVIADTVTRLWKEAAPATTGGRRPFRGGTRPGAPGAVNGPPPGHPIPWLFTWMFWTEEAHRREGDRTRSLAYLELTPEWQARLGARVDMLRYARDVYPDPQELRGMTFAADPETGGDHIGNFFYRLPEWADDPEQFLTPVDPQVHGLMEAAAVTDAAYAGDDPEVPEGTPFGELLYPVIFGQWLKHFNGWAVAYLFPNDPVHQRAMEALRENLHYGGQQPPMDVESSAGGMSLVWDDGVTVTEAVPAGLLEQATGRWPEARGVYRHLPVGYRQGRLR